MVPNRPDGSAKAPRSSEYVPEQGGGEAVLAPGTRSKNACLVVDCESQGGGRDASALQIVSVQCASRYDRGYRDAD